MIVSVIPLKRLPRQMSWLDYGVPEEYRDTVRTGQLVTIPLRKTTVFGIIFSVKKEIPEELKGKEIKPFEKIIHDNPLLTTEQLVLVEKMATLYAVSPSIIASMMVPPLQKRKLAKIEITEQPTTNNTPLATEEFFYYKNKEERKTFFAEKIIGHTLILVPTVHDITEAFLSLTEEQQEQCIIWRSTLSQKEQFEAWFQVHNGNKSIILGTRGSVFLPFSQLQTILIDIEHHEQHKHWDQAPRFHTKDIARELAKTYGANICLASYSPSAAAYYASHKKHLVSNLPETLPEFMPAPIIIDIKKERFGKNYSPLSFQAGELAKDGKGDMFFYLNRRGYSSSISCSACAKVLTCPTCKLPLTYYLQEHKVKCHPCNLTRNVPNACPSCSGTLTQLKGVGVEQLETYIPHAEQISREIIRIDSDTEAPQYEEGKSYIIVGTDAALPHLRWDKIGSIVLVDIDQQLHIPEYTANEEVFHLIQYLQFHRSPESTLLIQTHHPEHVVFKGLKQPDLFYRLDLNLRRALLYPPYSYLMRFFYGHENAEYAQKIAEQVHKRITEGLTKTPKKIKLLPPIDMQPKYFRKKYWYAIMVKSDASLWQENLVWINQYIPGDWKVDPNPISLLSP